MQYQEPIDQKQSSFYFQAETAQARESEEQSPDKEKAEDAAAAASDAAPAAPTLGDKLASFLDGFKS